jgi:hypothetical protein
VGEGRGPALASHAPTPGFVETIPPTERTVEYPVTLDLRRSHA